MKVRKATSNDLNSIIKLEESFASDLRASPRSIRHNISSSNVDFFVSSFNNEICGCVIVFYRASSPKAYIASIVVAPGFRKKGTGAQLFRCAEQLAIKRKKTLMELDVETTNHAMLSLSKRMEYEIVDEKTNYYGTKRHAFRLAKELF